MKFLGIHYGHNATVCLIEDGRITFCQSEERLNRIKNSTGFPTETLAYIYEHIAAPDEIDRAVLYQRSAYGYLYLKSHDFKPTQYAEFLEGAFIARSSVKYRVLETDLGWRLYSLKAARTAADPRIRAEAHAYFSRALRLPPERVEYMDHHLSHAYSVVPSVRPWGRSLIFTLDGAGDDKCASVNLLEGDRLRVLSSTNHRNSLGYYYGATTRVMGMKPGEHEYKIMGLAPYARSSAYGHITQRLMKLLSVDDEGQWHSRPTPASLSAKLQEAFRYERFDNQAGAIQELTETLVCRWIAHWVKTTGCGDIGVAGGVFMNVKLSQRVLALPGVTRMFVMPSAADESCSIGCASWASATYDPAHPAEPLKDLYLGMSFDERATEQAIETSHAAERYTITKSADINGDVARLLAENRVVARCTGRMEFGARALGNRSILANASHRENIDLINEAIKSRDFWMPFAPSILESDMPRYVVGADRIAAPYMAITFDSTAAAQRDLAAGIHPKDRTMRPQSVSAAWSPDYHAILTRFKELTGMGGILNTSFNLHGEPVVGSPLDAIRVVDESGLEHLAVGDYLLTKKSASAARS